MSAYWVSQDGFSLTDEERSVLLSAIAELGNGEPDDETALVLDGLEHRVRSFERCEVAA